VTNGAVSLDALVELLDEIVSAGGAQGIQIRALGGVGVYLRTPGAPALLRREIRDLDVIVRRKDRRPLEDLLGEVGLEPELRFNTLQGQKRQIWWTPDRRTHVDVFLGEFSMCHAIDLEERLPPAHRALGAADLLLTKLQIVQLNMKDAVDAAALLVSHELGDGDGEGTLDRGRLAEVLGRDWGFYTTTTDNLQKLPGLVALLDDALAAQVARAGEEIVALLDRAPKTRAFKLRARVGRRVQWYELPDESLV